MVTPNGSVVSYDRSELIREVRELYGTTTSDQLVYATLPPDEKERLGWYWNRRDESD
jgi:hypothetical protein